MDKSFLLIACIADIVLFSGCVTPKAIQFSNEVIAFECPGGWILENQVTENGNKLGGKCLKPMERTYVWVHSEYFPQDKNFEEIKPIFEENIKSSFYEDAINADKNIYTTTIDSRQALYQRTKLKDATIEEGLIDCIGRTIRYRLLYHDGTAEDVRQIVSTLKCK